MIIKSTLKQSLLALAITAGTASVTWAGPSDIKAIGIEQQPLAAALKALSRQTDLQLMFSNTDVSSFQTEGVSGEMSAEEALKQLLTGTGLVYEYTAENTVVVKKGAEQKAIETRAKETSERSRTQVIEEVIVTATKRETSLQDTAMSITALGNEEIDRRGLVGMGDYLNSVPGVSVLDGAAGRTSLVVRGVSSNPQNEGESNGSVVGVYFGEVPITGLASYFSNPDIKMVDIERVEILRGPQGTLYGSSNLGGTVRNVPVSPNLQEFQGSIKAGYSYTGGAGSGNTDVQGIFNIPLIENQLAIRAVAYRYDNSGYYKNIGANDPNIAAGVATWGAVAATERDDVGNDEYVGGRISLLWEPTEKFSINLMYHHQKIDQDGWPIADLNLGQESFLQRGYKMRLSLNGDADSNESFADNIDIANIAVEYDLGWANLSSSTSWVDDDSKIYREGGPLFFGFIPFSQVLDYQNKGIFEEIRLSSQFDGPFQFIAGLYYEDIENVSPSTKGIYGGDPALNPFPEVLLFDLELPNFTKQNAIFGEVTYELTERLNLTLGGRVFHYKKDNSSIASPAAFFPTATVTTSKGEDTDSTFKVGLDYSPNEDTLLYTVWSQGYRLGKPLFDESFTLCDQNVDGFFDGTNITTGARVLDSDSVDNYELGGKFAFWDNRLQLNADVYQVDWDGIPAAIHVPPGCNVTVNAGKARVRGMDFEGSYYMGNNLLIKFGASYLDSELTEVAPLFVAGKPGDRLPGSPKYNFSLGLQYDFTVAGYNAFARSDYYYVGGFYPTVGQGGTEIGKYGKLNVRAGLLLNQVNIDIFANNLTDENAVTWIDGDGFANPRGYLLRPRTIGVNIGYSF